MMVDRIFVPGEIISLIEEDEYAEGKKKEEKVKRNRYQVEGQYPNGILCRNSVGVHRFLSYADLAVCGVIPPITVQRDVRKTTR